MIGEQLPHQKDTVSRPWPLGHILLEPWSTWEWLIWWISPFPQLPLRIAGPGRTAALSRASISCLGARVHGDMHALLSNSRKIVPLSLSRVDELSTQNYRWVTPTVLWHFCFLFFLLGETIWAQKSNYPLMMKQDESQIRAWRLFSINVALTMPARGWWLPVSNGGFIIVMFKRLPMALILSKDDVVLFQLQLYSFQLVNLSRQNMLNLAAIVGRFPSAGIRAAH